ncbi:MAG: DUF2490 domain-containing protein [Deltaproteobacteria bacterium]|nr:DUF2490 domain-containing protein [Deltaproteobacteria bacterium]
MKKRVLMRVSKIKFSSTRRARWFGWMALTVAALCTGLPAQAATDSETQIWTSATLQSDPSHASGVVGWLDLHARRGTGSTVYILRPGIGYRLIQGVTGYVGYAYVPTALDGKADKIEHRTWQQFILQGNAAEGLTLMLRPRLEQRFGSGDDLGHRLRIMARGTYTFSGLPLMLVLWNETFYQFNNTDWGLASGFDQNRLFAGLGFPTASGPRFEVGFMNVFQNREPTDHSLNILAVNAFWTF